MKKKVLALLLAVVMAASLLATPAMAIDYPDAQNSWAKSSIDRWSNAGIVGGDDQGKINPDQALRRAELAIILVRLLGLTERAPMGTFTDVPAGAWYEDGILKCAAAGIMQGWNGHVDPLDNITREEAITMVGRALGVKSQPGQRLDQFQDAGKVQSYAQQYMAPLTAMGILKGVGDGSRVAPQDYIDRASALSLLDKAIGAYVTQPGNVNVNNANTFVVVNVKGAKDGDAVTISGMAAGVAVTIGNTADVTMRGFTAGTVKVDAPVDVVVSEGSKLSDVTLNSPAVLDVAKGAEVESVNVSSVAANAAITNAGTIGAVSANAAVAIDNQGTVTVLNANANGVSIKGTDAVNTTTSNGASVDNSGAKTPSTTTFGGDGGGGRSPSGSGTKKPAVSDASIYFITSKAEYKEFFKEDAPEHDIRLPWIVVKYVRNNAGTVDISVRKDGAALQFGKVAKAEDGAADPEPKYTATLSEKYTTSNQNAYVAFHMYSQAETDHKYQDWLNQPEPETEPEEAVYQVTVELGTAIATASATYPAPNKTELTKAIEAAKARVEAVQVSEDGTDVPATQQWVTQAVKTIYEKDIEAAEDVANRPDARTTDVEKAVADLAAATERFETAKKPGGEGAEDPDDPNEAGESGGPGSSVVTVAELTKAIADAEAVTLGEIKISAQNGDDVWTDEQWIAKSVKDTFDEVLRKAKAATANTATQEQLNAATALTTATTALKTAIENAEHGKKEKVIEYDLTYVAENGNVSFTVNGKTVTKAAAGDVVKVVTDPHPSYKLGSINSDDVTISNATFTMPARNVTVTVTFEKDEHAPTVTSVSVAVKNGAEATVEAGSTLELVATAHMSDGSQVETAATWSSKSEAATVDVNTGKVTGVDAGTAEITATVGGVSGTIEVTVTKYVPPEYDLTYATENGNVSFTVNGQTVTKAAVGDVVTVVTEANENYELDSITIDNEPVSNATFTMPDHGVTVTVTFKKKTNAPVVQNVAVTVQGDADPTVEVEGTLQLVATVKMDNGDDYAGDDVTWTWSSGNEEAASVDANGMVTGVAAAESPVTITATATIGETTVSGTIEITVTAKQGPGTRTIVITLPRASEGDGGALLAGLEPTEECAQYYHKDEENGVFTFVIPADEEVTIRFTVKATDEENYKISSVSNSTKGEDGVYTFNSDSELGFTSITVEVTHIPEE